MLAPSKGATGLNYYSTITHASARFELTCTQSSVYARYSLHTSGPTFEGDVDPGLTKCKLFWFSNDLTK